MVYVIVLGKNNTYSSHLKTRSETNILKLYEYKLAHTNIRRHMKKLLILIVAIALFLHFQK